MQSLYRIFPVLSIAVLSFQTLFAQTNCGYVILPAGAVVWIEMSSPLSPDAVAVGNNVDFTVYQDVVHNNKTLIATGAPVQARIKKIAKDSATGKQQVFIYPENVVAVNGQSIELSSTPLQILLSDRLDAPTQLYKIVGRSIHNNRIDLAPEANIPRDTAWSLPLTTRTEGKSSGKRKKTTVPAGTAIMVETAERLNSCQLTVGRTIPLRVCADVVVNGRTVVAAGAIAMGRIASLAKAEAFTAEGFTIESLYVMAVDGTPVQINGQSNEIAAEFPGENVVAPPGQKLLTQCLNDVVVRARR